MTPSGKSYRGRCLCGSVAFEVEIPEARFSVCHCGMCRRWAGGPWMSVHCPRPAVFSEDSGLAWYRGSDWAERGFCSTCGTSLFYRLADNPDGLLVVAVDALEDATDLALDRHIYIDAKPDRYDFADDRPRLTEAEFLAEIGATPGAEGV
jgi:hypothetical protein